MDDELGRTWKGMTKTKFEDNFLALVYKTEENLANLSG
jgi:hypothetical protein